jgi:hypothetical protein
MLVDLSGLHSQLVCLTVLMGRSSRLSTKAFLRSVARNASKREVVCGFAHVQIQDCRTHYHFGQAVQAVDDMFKAAVAGFRAPVQW